MKIIHINCVYPYGSTGRITQDLHNAALSKGYQSLVLHSRGIKNQFREAVSVCGTLGSKINHAIANATGIMYGGCFFSTTKIIGIIKKEKPDLVHLQCINGYFVNISRLLNFLKKSKIQTIITLHAEFMYTGNCALTMGCEKWKNGCGKCPQLRQATDSYFFDRTKKSHAMFKKAFSGFGNRLTVVGVSDWLSCRAAASPIMEGVELRRIYNGINTKNFNSIDAESLKKDLQIKENEKVVLWVTSGYTEAKGKDFFLALYEKLKHEPFRFLVVGSDNPEETHGKIEFLGKIKDPQLLAQYYAVADVFVCCSRQESYPTVCLEAQCCGTPVVGFDVGGVAESISCGMGETVPLGEVDAMALAVRHWAHSKDKIPKAVVESCLMDFSVQRMQKEYIDLYESMQKKL